MNRFLKAAAIAPFRVMPGRVRRSLVQAALQAAARRPPLDALRELLTLDADLSGAIDLTAMAYEGGIHVKHRLTGYHDFFVARIGAADRVLDIGCGYGAVAHSIASRTGARVTGLDMDRANIARASQLFPRRENLVFVEGTAPRVLPDGAFDVIVLSNVLEHIERRIEFIRTIQTRLAPRRWLIRVPMFNRDWRPTLRKEIGLFPYGDPTHFVEYTRETFEDEMLASGLAIGHLQINWGEIWAEARPS
jgi:SAM-dependent methyltransferase